jgi:hypothetical protein
VDETTNIDKLFLHVRIQVASLHKADALHQP